MTTGTGPFTILSISRMTTTMYNDSEKELFVSSAVNREHVADIVVVLVVAVFATDADTSMLIQ